MSGPTAGAAAAAESSPAAAAAAANDSLFQTPLKLRNRLQKIADCSPASAKRRRSGSSSASPALSIPPSPCLTKLGFGTGVSVFLYERSPSSRGENRSPWALKKLNRRHAGGEFARRLEDEARVLRALRHPHIIGYRGFKRAADGAHVLALQNGQQSLFDVIELAREEDEFSPLPSKHILKVLECVSSALDYLHSEHRLLHGDLKAANVLIIGDFEDVKLCDFGVTLKMNEDGSVPESVQYVGTQAWSAPEVVAETPLSAKTDIFALGCIVYEMLALEGPHMDKLPGFDESVEGDGDGDDAFQEAVGTRPDLPEHIRQFFQRDYKQVLSLFYACTHEAQAKRPSAKTILECLAAAAKVGAAAESPSPADAATESPSPSDAAAETPSPLDAAAETPSPSDSAAETPSPTTLFREESSGDDDAN